MRTSRRWKIAGVAGVLAIAAAAWTVLHYHVFDGTASTPLSIEEARDRYREVATSTVDPSTTTAATPSTAPATTSAAPASASATSSTSSTSSPSSAVVPQLPPLGVYVYTTSGRDEVDALGGAHHDYPATTTITVTPSECGVLQRWDVLQERWEAWDRCIDGDTIRQPARTTSDQFFGQTQTDSYTCTGDARPIDAPVGTTWIITCVQGAEADVHTGEIIGTESLTVGDHGVPTLHVRVSITTADTPSDVQTIDTWYQSGSDLVIAQTAHSATSNPSPIGAVHYVEDYEIHLTSLTPLT
jgi:hypothetical protein